jgi:hypothetical protein
LKITPYHRQDAPNTLDLEFITKCHDESPLHEHQLSDLEEGGWVGNVFEVVDKDGETGTLIYVPNVAPVDLFPTKGGK